MAQIIRITSEALQATIRRLLPSQQGFGEDLQASNVIQPIIDLTPTAEGSQLPDDLARAPSHGSQTDLVAANGTVIAANTPGFYRITGAVTLENGSGVSNSAEVYLDDGSTLKTIAQWGNVNGSKGLEYVDIVFFLDTNESCGVSSTGFAAYFSGSIRQVADRYGNIVNPSGFTFE